MISSLMLLLTGFVVALFAGPEPVIGAITSSLQSILKNTHGSKEYGYPTDLTRDILPSPILIATDAIQVITGEMNPFGPVGHDQSALTAARTLESLYINPILDVLERQNPESPFVTSPTKKSRCLGHRPGSNTLLLHRCENIRARDLRGRRRGSSPLREKGYLTTLKNNETITNGPVTIIGTGETTLEMVAPIADRDYFFDAPLADLNDPKYDEVTSLVSPIASTDFEEAVGPVTADTEPILTDSQLSALRDQISTAKARGIGARYWNTPYWPVRTRNLVWRTLVHEGVKLLNADDLNAVVASF
ncbi:hypothetical protein N7474_000189 [Penicillium riverlandense]|uniref:uncharacterized protein n=1 Tax=Penicillium riverlandense TaxID=1903569 RepID=UPI002548B8A1|nr:uncharacterized protein N7474_000189 [Penicillium riverlandense]KAJ5831878.1 hypothetical protein N7474_000189 [Penicillium riverlandense]